MVRGRLRRPHQSATRSRLSAAGRVCGRPSWGPWRAHLGARDPSGGKAAAVTQLDVKARETQVAVVPPRPSPPPKCQSLTRASSWTACAWQGRHMRAWVRARAWSGKARASWARSYRTVGSRSSMRATGGAFSANLPPPPLRVRCPRARHTGWRPRDAGLRVPQGSGSIQAHLGKGELSTGGRGGSLDAHLGPSGQGGGSNRGGGGGALVPLLGPSQAQRGGEGTGG